MERTKNEVLSSTTKGYLRDLDTSNGIDTELIEAELLEIIRNAFELENSIKQKNRRWAIPQELPNFIIAEIILRLYSVRRLLWAGSECDGNYDLVIYQTDGKNEGIYVADKDALSRLIRNYNRAISMKSVDEVISNLAVNAPLCKANENPDLIAVNNGIFDYKTKRLLPFAPDIVFTAKSSVNYNPNAVNISIHNDSDNTDWDVESWMNDLSDDPEIVQLLWQMLGAIIRPNVSWNKVACMYSNTGNNGKGTLCELMRNLCGKGNYANIPFSDFGKDFMLQPLTHVSAIITDENKPKSFTSAADALKAIISGDAFTVNRKFLIPITMKFKGLMVQCVNDLPRFLDKTDSLYRRFLMIPFEKCFTGKERKYIKNDYLNKQDVLEYVLYKVLNTSYYEFSEPDACKALLNEYKVFNDPIRQFIDEVLPECVWDLIPNQFLYDLYKAWFSKNSPSGQVQGKNSFIKDVQNILVGSSEWTITTGSVPTRNLMDKPEQLIIEYDLKDWMNNIYRGGNTNKICTPTVKSSYSGLLRK